MPDTTPYILSTRPVPDLLIEEAREKGVVIDAVPFIDTEPLQDERLCSLIRALGQQHLTAVFTSMNAVDAVASWVGSGPVTWTIYCIGGATRERVSTAFPHARIADVADSAAVLAEKIAEPQVYFFCGDQRREELPALLEAKGCRVDEWVVYKTIPTPQVICRRYDGVVFFSPSAVKSFFLMNTVSQDVAIFTIGPTTAEAVRQQGSYPLIIADHPDKESLIRKAIEHFQKKHK